MNDYDDERIDQIAADRVSKFIAAYTYNAVSNMAALQPETVEETKWVFSQKGWAEGVIEATNTSLNGEKYIFSYYGNVAVSRVLDDLGAPTTGEVIAMERKDATAAQIEQIEVQNKLWQWILNGELMKRCARYGDELSFLIMSELKDIFEYL